MHANNGWGKAGERRAWQTATKSVPCTDCGVAYPPYVMQFDHVPNRGPKLFNISEAVRDGTWTVEQVKAEAEKCDIVCANCHAVRTHTRSKK